MQVVGAVQMVPQLPQFDSSVVRSTQPDPEQHISVRPPAQSSPLGLQWQLPSTQLSPELQRSPH